MLKTVLKKLCPVLSLTMATVGCGKKATEASTQIAGNIENQELPSAHILRLDATEGSSKRFSLHRPFTFQVPSSIKIRSGNFTNNTIEITYDIDEHDEENFQFKCFYKGPVNISDMTLDHCVDYENNDLGNLSGQQFGLYKADIIEVKFTSAPTQDMLVEAIYSVKWF